MRKDTILFIISFSSLVIPVLQIFNVLPSLFFEGFDVFLIGLTIYGLNLPQLALGKNHKKLLSLPFIACGIVSYVSVLHANTVYLGMPIVVAIYLILLFYTERKVDWNNLEGKLAKTWQLNFNSTLKSDPDFYKKDALLFWTLVSIPEIRITQLLVIMRLTLPIYTGAMGFMLALGILESHFPISSILASILILMAASKLKKIRLAKKGSKLLQVAKKIISTKDSLEETKTESFIRKFAHPRALLYLLIIITAASFSVQAPIWFFTFSVMFLEGNQTEFSTLQNAIYGSLWAMGSIPFFVPAYCAIQLFIARSVTKTRLLPFTYPWLVYSAFIFFILNTKNEFFFWLLDFNFNEIEFRSILFGIAGIVCVIHIIVSCKFKKLTLFSKKIEDLLTLFLFPFPVIVLSQGDFVNGFMMTVIASWTWHSFMSFFRTPLSEEFVGKPKIHVVSLALCLLTIGIYFQLTGQYVIMSYAGFIGAGFASILLLETKKKNMIAKYVFGISERYQKPSDKTA